MFGHKRFTITDPNLFGSGNNHAREVELAALQLNALTNELIEPLEVCQTVYNYYTYCTTPNAPTCSITCDECWWCTATLPITYCWTVYVNTGGGSTGTGTTTSGGGGSSTNTPPPCPPGTILPDTYGTVCQPGWTPSSSPPPKDPCDKVAPLTTDSLYKAKAMELKNSTNLNYEKAWVMDTSGVFYYFQGPPGIDQKVNLIVNFPTANVNHSHTNKDLFSIDDLFSAWRFLYANQIHDSVFTLGVCNTQGSYLFTIDNPVEFLTFGNKYFKPEGIDEDIDRFYRGYKIGKANDPAINENRFLEFVKKFTVGITLLKANADFTGYQKLILNRDGQLVVVPCN